MKMLRACWQAFAAKEMEESISLLRDGLKRAVQPVLVLLKSQLVWGLPPRIFILPPVLGESDDKCKKVTNARHLNISFPVLIICLGDLEASIESCTYHLSITLNLLKNLNHIMDRALCHWRVGLHLGDSFHLSSKQANKTQPFYFSKSTALKTQRPVPDFFYVHTLL